MTAPHVLYADGASRGNPGPAAIGAVLYPPGGGEAVVEVSEAIGEATNNQAEYRAVIAGLEKALDLGVTDLAVRLDSLLLVRQVAGEYRVRNAALKPLHRRVVSLLGRFRAVTMEHVPRERNTAADSLANAALDR
jgi:ribonuclease HI